MTDRIWIELQCGCVVAMRLELPHVTLCVRLCGYCHEAGRRIEDVEHDAKAHLDEQYRCPNCGTDEPGPTTKLHRCGKCDFDFGEKWPEKLIAFVVKARAFPREWPASHRPPPRHPERV